MIDFFLSSDDDSIAHGTIWPAEVRAALDRMSLMLIFVSSEALKSGWTYFEAGYGLHKLKTANIYCLPGTDKAALPSPFNILQNRNLHTPRELGLLIAQINDAFGAKISAAVTRQEFDKLFKKPALGVVEAGPAFEELVESVTVSTVGPPNSIEAFSQVCRRAGLPVSAVTNDTSQTKDERCSTGVRIAVNVPDTRDLEEEIEITDEMKQEGYAAVEIWGDHWTEPGPWSMRLENKTLQQIRAYNSKIQKQNDKIRRQNSKRLAEPRKVSFALSPINFSVSVGVVDVWMIEVNIRQPLVANIRLGKDVTCENKTEAVSAKIYGSQLALRDDGTLLWAEKIIVTLPTRGYDPCKLTASDANANLSAFNIPELLTTLFELNIISSTSQRRAKRKR